MALPKLKTDMPSEVFPSNWEHKISLVLIGRNPFFPPTRLCTYIREANGLLSFRVWQKLLVLLSVRIVISAGWIENESQNRECGRRRAGFWFANRHIRTWVSEHRFWTRIRQFQRAQTQGKNGRNVRLLSYIDHYWWKRILSSINWSETGRALAQLTGLLQPRSQPGPCVWHECQKLTDPPPGSSSPARGPPLLDRESSRWEWGSSLFDWVPSLRLWRNGSGFWRRGTWGCEYLCEKRGKRFNHTEKK